MARHTEIAAGRQRALGGALNHRPVCDRIGKRDADFQNVCAGSRNRQQNICRGRRSRVARRHIGHKPGRLSLSQRFKSRRKTAHAFTAATSV